MAPYRRRPQGPNCPLEELQLACDHAPLLWTCVVEGCGVATRPNTFFCPDCWSRIPRKARRELFDSWDFYVNTDGHVQDVVNREFGRVLVTVANKVGLRG